MKSAVCMLRILSDRCIMLRHWTRGSPSTLSSATLMLMVLLQRLAIRYDALYSVFHTFFHECKLGNGVLQASPLVRGNLDGLVASEGEGSEERDPVVRSLSFSPQLEPGSGHVSWRVVFAVWTPLKANPRGPTTASTEPDLPPAPAKEVYSTAGTFKDMSWVHVQIYELDSILQRIIGPQAASGRV